MTAAPALNESILLEIEQALQQAVFQHQAGQLALAKELYQAILQVHPAHSEANHNMGVLAVLEKQPEASLSYFLGALDADPARGQYWLSYIDALVQANQIKNARQVLKLARQNGLQGDAVEALAAQLKSREKITKPQKKISKKSPGAQEIYDLFALFNTGRYADTITSAQKMTVQFPLHGFGWKVLGAVYKRTGQHSEALAAMQKAAELLPNDAEAQNNLGIAMHEQGQFNAAITNFRLALRIKSDYSGAHFNLGNTLRDLGRLDEAASSFRNALKIEPGYVEAHTNLGNTLKDLGQLEAAIASCKKAIEIKPDASISHTNLIFLYAYHALLQTDAYLEQCMQWQKNCIPALDIESAQKKIFQRPPLSNRRLKVGYVSGDFCQHAVSYFVEQLFYHHNKDKVELFAYSANVVRDAATERLASFTDHWRQIAGLPDNEVLERIEADQIDVLIDLSGHTAHNRLGIFARRAAPVQAHYLGFFASTGLTEMDYWIGDEILTPPDTDSHFSEQVWRLPRVWVSYEGKADAPLPAWQPDPDGTLWLGSFNNLGKLTPATLKLWAKLLHALPGGKLLLKTKELKAPDNRRRILDAFAAQGVTPDRIELQDGSTTLDWYQHMAYYNRLDIALDPVGGVGGGTTTCDALWMGLPLITLAGDRMATRMTDSMLHAIDHPEWVAVSEEDYIDKVITLARDVEQRKALRSSQRQKMAASPLCDASDLASTLEQTYVDMFYQKLTVTYQN